MAGAPSVILAFRNRLQMKFEIERVFKYNKLTVHRSHITTIEDYSVQMSMQEYLIKVLPVVVSHHRRK